VEECGYVYFTYLYFVMIPQGWLRVCVHMIGYGVGRGAFVAVAQHDLVKNSLGTRLGFACFMLLILLQYILLIPWEHSLSHSCYCYLEDESGLSQWQVLSILIVSTSTTRKLLYLSVRARNY